MVAYSEAWSLSNQISRFCTDCAAFANPDSGRFAAPSQDSRRKRLPVGKHLQPGKLEPLSRENLPFSDRFRQRLTPVSSPFSRRSLPTLFSSATYAKPPVCRYFLAFRYTGSIDTQKGDLRRPGFAGMTTPAAPSEACRSQNRMLNQCHGFSDGAATKPCISWVVRHKFRQIRYLPRASWPKPLKTKNLTKTTPGGGGGSMVVQT